MIAVPAALPLIVGGVFAGGGVGVGVGVGDDELTVMENGPSFAVDVPSDAVMTMFEYTPISRVRGTPKIVPRLLLK